MKIRTDFVTNSSSSSFIIGKKDDIDITINSVYSRIRDLFIKFKTQIEESVELIKNYGCTVYYDEKCGHYSVVEDNLFKHLYEYDRTFCKIYYDLLDSYLFDQTVIDAKTYEEYIAKKKENNSKSCFYLFDLSKKSDTDSFYPYSSEKIRGYKSFILYWYHPEVKYAFENLHDCRKCSNYKNCYERKNDYYVNKIECLKFKEEIIKNNYLESKDEIASILLGKILVYIEEGDKRFPENVFNYLHSISEHSCGHMG